MEINIDYIPHKYQQLIHNDPAPYKVISAGRQFGKSMLARWTILLSAIREAGKYWIVSPTIKQGKDNHWNDPENNILRDTEGWRLDQNITELAIEVPARNGKSRIELKGIENLEKVRGSKLRGVVMDEAAFLTEYSWTNVIQPMMTTTGGWAMFISTPNGFNWFKDLYQQGTIYTVVQKYPSEPPIWKAKLLKPPKQGRLKGWSSYHFTSYDNPFAKPEIIESARLEAISKNSEDNFFQEYVADFRKVSGLIYKNFNRNIHVIDPIEIEDHWDVYRGVDFGFDNPTACVWVAVSPEGKWYIIDEYYEKKESSDYHIGMILSKSQNYPHAEATYADPSAPQNIIDWGKKGLYMTGARKDMGTNKGEWVGHGTDLIQEKLKINPIDKKPTLFVFKGCTQTIREFESYRWKEEKNTELNKPGVPLKANDHLMDALRYVIVSYHPPSHEVFPDDTGMFEGGYY
ncbi:MAG: hypothetical protein A2163_07960 [Actinobacteria bacterium RBG_13_35_12]|nr:MAG: hypothetical protein A2163_07960 [Actinobacteria bacterium RBG_13_35_12]